MKNSLNSNTNNFLTYSESCQEFRRNLIHKLSWTLFFTLLGFLWREWVMSYGDSRIIPNYVKISIVYSFAAIPAGWRAMNKLTDNLILFTSPIGWTIYFFFKTMVACIVGLAALPCEVVVIYFQWRYIQSLRGKL